jgi:hypothetical protein
MIIHVKEQIIFERNCFIEILNKIGNNFKFDMFFHTIVDPEKHSDW